MNHGKNPDAYTRGAHGNVTLKVKNLSKYTKLAHRSRKHSRKHTNRKIDWGKWILGTIGGIILTLLLAPTIAPLVYLDTPTLIIQAYRDPVQSMNGPAIFGSKWNSRFVLFDVSVQVHSQKTAVDDVNLMLDFDAAILAVKEQAVVEATNPSITYPPAPLIVQNGTQVAQNATRYYQFSINIGSLATGGLYALWVVVDPQYQGPIFRSELFSYPGYSGSFRYDAYGYPVTKDITGPIPTEQ